MPIFEFECQKCGKILEVWAKPGEEVAPPTCDCGGETKKIISQSSFILKGSGWYVTDYKRKGCSPNGCSCGSSGDFMEKNPAEKLKEVNKLHKEGKMVDISKCPKV